MAKITFNPSQLEDMRSFLNADNHAFSRVIGEDVWSKAMTVTELTQGLDLAPDSSSRAVRFLMGLTAIVRNNSVSPEKIIADIGESLEKQELQAWSDKKQLVLELLDSPGLQRVGKVLSLSYQYANILKESKIFADIRPVFDAEGDTVQAAVVTFTLRLSYGGAKGEKESSFALDLSDLEMLEEECRRAIKKGRIAKATLNKPLAIQAVISGDYGMASDAHEASSKVDDKS